jgi:pectinesterase
VANTATNTSEHAFTIYGKGDRTVIVDCDILSEGGDTLSLWLAQSGRYYHTRCAFRGAVDFVCPRGWCYISDSSFFETRKTAALWHDGSRDKDMKFVLRNCTFDGVQGWYLARHHHDAQFFLLDCTFAATMIDRRPFRVTYPLSGAPPDDADKKKNADLDKTNRWGERVWYSNCHRETGDFAWHKDNLADAPGAPAADRITAAWTFAAKWDPENRAGPVVRAVEQRGRQIAVTWSENVTAKGKPRLVLSGGGFADYSSGSGSNTLLFTMPKDRQAQVEFVEIDAGFIIATQAAAALRSAELKFSAEDR